jgi:hypothetical protein
MVIFHDRELYSHLYVAYKHKGPNNTVHALQSRRNAVSGDIDVGGRFLLTSVRGGDEGTSTLMG